MSSVGLTIQEICNTTEQNLTTFDLMLKSLCELGLELTKVQIESDHPPYKALEN